MTERKPMPLAFLDEPFPNFESVAQHLESLTKRIVNYLAMEPYVVVEHPYEQLDVALWLQSVPNGYIAHMLIADPEHIASQCPDDALFFDIGDAIKKEQVRIRDVHEYLRSDAWVQVIHTDRHLRWLTDFPVA
ncbi:hypothetical protein [Rhizobium sp. BK456]|uniref:hypothetical protein n=1 Tax=Rhizobium sp. BK456 TaxID=2587007 RepID=UPI001616ACDA|nr:hypothetical protein [Rhizobium sp. BK456]MBB3520992.1 hypothetical protein [Rhizobium sp. BK456]